MRKILDTTQAVGKVSKDAASAVFFVQKVRKQGIFRYNCYRIRPPGLFGNMDSFQQSCGNSSGFVRIHPAARKIESGEVHYDFVEVMACQGGCIAGAGQPFVVGRARAERSQGMYEADQLSNVRTSQGNPVTENLYNGLLAGENAHRLLHYK